MTRHHVLLAAAVCAVSPLTAQTDEQQVLAVVNQLFDGMRTKDTALVRSAFHRNGRMVSINGDSTVAGGIDGFVGFVGGPSDEIWNEPIWDTEVKIDGNLASVWTKYVFLRGPEGDQFSHCGVDAFLLHKGSSGWKISILSDTRQTEGCEMPPGS